MLLVKRILDGDDASTYLPLATRKLASMNERWNGHLQHQVIANADVTIRLYLWAKDRGEVRITAGTLAYDFFTSTTFNDGDAVHDAGSFTNALNRAALQSSIFTRAGADGPDWILTDMPGKLLTHLSVNRQRNPEYSWWGQSLFMQSTLAINSAGNSFDARRIYRGLFTSNELGQRIEIDAFAAPDIGFDVPPTVYSREKTLPLVALNTAPHWWRRACVRVVDGRAFVIATDALSNFYAYPVGTEGAERLNGTWALPEAGYIMVEADSYLPAWATPPTLESQRPIPSPIQYARDGTSGVILLDFTTINAAYVPPSFDYSAFPGEAPGWDRKDVLQDNHYVWSFNADATRAVAVVGSDELPRFAEDVSANPTTGATEVRTVRFKHLKNYSPSVRVPYYTEQLRLAELDAIGGLREGTINRRGVLEVDLTLTVTGTEPMDFTFTVAARTELQDEHYVDADYAFRDKRLKDLGVDAGTLLVARLRRYMAKSGGEWIPGTDADNGATVTSRTFLEVTKADSSPVKAWQLGSYTQQNLISRLAADLHLQDFAAVTFPPYGTHATFGTHRTLQYRDMTIDSMSARVSVLALDLKSLSAVIECETYADPGFFFDQSTQYGVNTAVAAYFYGEKVQAPALTAHLDEPAPAEGLMPATYKGAHGGEPTDVHTVWLDLYRMDQDFMLGELQNGLGIASHPKGHAAVAIVRGGPGNSQAVDLIHQRVGTSSKASTHLDSYNRAWGQSHTYEDFLPVGATTPYRLQGYAIWRDLQPKKVTGYSYG